MRATWEWLKLGYFGVHDMIFARQHWNQPKPAKPPRPSIFERVRRAADDIKSAVAAVWQDHQSRGEK